MFQPSEDEFRQLRPQTESGMASLSQLVEISYNLR